MTILTSWFYDLYAKFWVLTVWKLVHTITIQWGSKIPTESAGSDVSGDEDNIETNDDSDDEVETLPDVSEDDVVTGDDSGVDVGLTGEKLTNDEAE